MPLLRKPVSPPTCPFMPAQRRRLSMASGNSARSRPIVRHQPQFRLDCSPAMRPFSHSVTETPFLARWSAALTPTMPPPTTTTSVRVGGAFEFMMAKLPRGYPAKAGLLHGRAMSQIVHGGPRRSSRHCERNEDSMGVDSGRSYGRLRLRSDSLWRLPMSLDPHEEPAAIQTHIGAIFISLELSRSKWLITSLVPGGGQRMSKHWVEAGDLAGLLARFWAIRDKVLARTEKSYPIVVIQEAGLDGFWIHRSLVKEGIESHVVDAASIAVSRRRRRAKTDKIDGEGLLRALLAFKRGEPRVCSMVRVPTPQDEDRRRICRERKTLTAERIRHVNRIKGLLFSQGIGDYEPLRRDRRRALEAVCTGDGRALGANMKAQIGRELDRLELLLDQIAAVEAERDAMLARQAEAEAAQGDQSVR